MKNDINLISAHKHTEKKPKDVFLLSSLGIFGVIFAISILILLISFFQKSQLSSLNNSVNGLKSRMSLLSSEKNKILTTENRLSTIQKVLSTRSEVDVKMEAIISSLPTNFAINEFSGSEKEVNVSLLSTSLSDFDILLEEKIPSLTKDESLGITHIDIGSFIAEDGNYSLKLTIYF